MNKDWLKLWNDRYKKDAYAYGEKPNVFLKEQLKKFSGKKILFAAEGEGRNAVFAAKQNWDVSAFDISIEGKNKAQRLAEKNAVQIDYRLGELETLNFTENEFDAIALIYAHFPPNIRSKYHKLLTQYLKKDGIIIFEAFSKNHLKYRLENENVGGPKSLELLFSLEEIKSDFNNFEVIELSEKEIELSEGLGHNGLGSVIRFVGRKK